MNRHDFARIGRVLYGENAPCRLGWGWEKEFANDLGVPEHWVWNRVDGTTKICFVDLRLIVYTFDMRTNAGDPTLKNPHPWLRLVCEECAFVKTTHIWRVLLLPEHCGREMLIAGWPKLNRMMNTWIDPVDNIIPRPKRLRSAAA